MPRPPRVQFPEALYHVTVRGVEKRNIVRDDRDRARWCEYLKSAVSRFGLDLYAFALLDNHFHLFLSAPNENLDKAMQYLNGAHAMYFNTRHERKGHLFQNRYHAVLIETRGHYTEVSRYVHLNPVRALLAKRPEDYPWSSYPGYHSGRLPLPWLNYGRVLLEFADPNAKLPTKGVRPLLWRQSGKWKEALERYRQFVAEGIGKKLAPPWARAIGGWLLGTPKFTAKIYALLAKDRKDSRWDSRAGSGKRAIDATLDEIAQAVCKEFRITPVQLKSCVEQSRSARRAFGLIARESGGHSWRSIAELLGLADRSTARALAMRGLSQKGKEQEFSQRIMRLELHLK